MILKDFKVVELVRLPSKFLTPFINLCLQLGRDVTKFADLWNVLEEYGGHFLPLGLLVAFCHLARRRVVTGSDYLTGDRAAQHRDGSINIPINQHEGFSERTFLRHSEALLVGLVCD